MGNQKKELVEWINLIIEDLDCDEIINIVPLREQASLRNYFRLETDKDTKIAVSSDPMTDVNRVFENLSSCLLKKGIKVPKIEAFDHEAGFMVMEDFGDKVLQLEMNPEDEQKFYKSAINQLHLIQRIRPFDGLKELSSAILRDQMKLFEEWFLIGLLNFKCSSKQQRIISDAYEHIAQECSSQPQVLCHFDFEFRNLMLLEGDKLGILDFQDLCIGAYSLDLVSILKDLENPLRDKDLEKYLIYFLRDLNDLDNNYLYQDNLRRDVDFSGFQRQLRILGTLSRLHLRDNKSFRLLDLVQTLKFLIDDLKKYNELTSFQEFLVEQVEPSLHKALEVFN